MPTTQHQNPLVIGWLPSSPAGARATLQLAAANTWLALSFIPPETKTLSKVKLFNTAVTGSIVAADSTLSLFSDTTAGIPSTSLEGPKSADSVMLANTWGQWSGFTTSCTGGTRYWIVWKNANATPASNNFTLAWMGGTTGAVRSWVDGTQAATIGYGWNKLQSADGGSTWASALANIGGFRLEYSDGSFDGWPIQNLAAEATASGIFANREVGVVLTTPANASLNVRGAIFPIHKIGSPTGHLRYRLYNGVTLLDTTPVINSAHFAGAVNSYLGAYFAAKQTIVGGSTLRVVASESAQADANTNRFEFQAFTVENDANSLALMPFQGTLQRTETADATAGPVVFSNTATTIFPFGLILDTDGEFASQSSGGLVRANMSGGVL